MKALSPINSSNPCLPKTHFLKVPVFHLFFKFKPFPYNNHGAKRAHTLSFTINCKLKSSQDIKNKGKGVPHKIVLSESSPPPLTEDDDINGGSDSGGSSGNLKEKGRPFWGGQHVEEKDIADSL
ncbi:cytochrome c biogenesis protein CCS1, chloroplastic [Sesbania bispinosa]|nr:cytochrome c biogenesis protein CCS1, chloroplastic [Sesbania bispinosa]